MIVSSATPALERRKRLRPLSSLENTEEFQRPTISFQNALRTDSLAIISEIKHSSPSKGILRDNFSPTDIATAYEENGAAAISVLTESNYFKGHLDHLREVRSAVNIPVLRKDFIVDPYQVFEARAYGADAVLLIATLLDKVHLSELHAAASELDLSCLVEIYEEQELDWIDLDLVSVLGVNNRNLRTFEVDISRAPTILKRMPEHIVTVAESGIQSGEELALMQNEGIDAVLIGESLMKESDPGRALLKLKKDCEEYFSRESN